MKSILSIRFIIFGGKHFKKNSKNIIDIFTWMKMACRMFNWLSWLKRFFFKMLGYDLHCINMNLVRWIIWDMDNIIVLEIGQLHVSFFKEYH